MSAQPEEFLNHIQGEWVRSRAGRTFANTNPHDARETVGLFQASGSADAEAAVAAASAARGRIVVCRTRAIVSRQNRLHFQTIS